MRGSAIRAGPPSPAPSGSSGRIIYAVGYWQDAKKRTPGFAITVFALVAVWIGALISVIRALAIE